MSKHNLIIILGLLTAVLPFLGLPFSFKKWGAFVLGVAIIIITIWVKREIVLEDKISLLDDRERTYSDSEEENLNYTDYQYSENEQSENSEEKEE